MDNHIHVCHNHPDTVAQGQCAVCGEWFCRDCLVQQHGKLFCKAHASPQKLRKKRGPLFYVGIILGALVLWYSFVFAVKSCSANDPPRETTGSDTTSAGAIFTDEFREALSVFTPFDPIEYTGTGDSVIFLDDIPSGWVLYAEGNAEDRYFCIQGYDDNDQLTELFVNTTEPYCGTTIDGNFATTQLEITATGEWRIEIRPLIGCDTITVGEPYKSTGDAVLIVSGDAKTADIYGNARAAYFGVHAIGAGSSDLLVNTTEAYSGTVKCKNNPQFIVVIASDEWGIRLNG